jgi:hypothetical protein
MVHAYLITLFFIPKVHAHLIVFFVPFQGGYTFLLLDVFLLKE